MSFCLDAKRTKKIKALEKMAKNNFIPLPKMKPKAKLNNYHSANLPINISKSPIIIFGLTLHSVIFFPPFFLRPMVNPYQKDRQRFPAPSRRPVKNIQF